MSLHQSAKDSAIRLDVNRLDHADAARSLAAEASKKRKSSSKSASQDSSANSPKKHQHLSSNSPSNHQSHHTQSPRQGNQSPNNSSPKISAPPTALNVRAHVTKLLTSALSHSSSDARVASVAERIESHLFEVHSAADVPYRHHARALIAHLQDAKNAQLREDVLSGSMTPTEICQLSDEKLDNPEVKATRAHLVEVQQSASTIQDAPKLKSTEFVCRNCGSNETEYDADVSAGLDASKSETWGSKDSATATPKMIIRCLKCSRTWKREY